MSTDHLPLLRDLFLLDNEIKTNINVIALLIEQRDLKVVSLNNSYLFNEDYDEMECLQGGNGNAWLQNYFNLYMTSGCKFICVDGDSAHHCGKATGGIKRCPEHKGIKNSKKAEALLEASKNKAHEEKKNEKIPLVIQTRKKNMDEDFKKFSEQYQKLVLKVEELVQKHSLLLTKREEILSTIGIIDKATATNAATLSKNDIEPQLNKLSALLNNDASVKLLESIKAERERVKNMTIPEVIMLKTNRKMFVTKELSELQLAYCEKHANSGYWKRFSMNVNE